MSFSHFFIRRPIFASVISIVIVLTGLISFKNLSVTQYPTIAPPCVVVYGTYPGASPQIIMDTAISPLEQQLNGIENMMYMFSQATANGSFVDRAGLNLFPHLLCLRFHKSEDPETGSE